MNPAEWRAAGSRWPFPPGAAGGAAGQRASTHAAGHVLYIDAVLPETPLRYAVLLTERGPRRSPDKAPPRSGPRRDVVEPSISPGKTMASTAPDSGIRCRNSPARFGPASTAVEPDIDQRRGDHHHNATVTAESAA